MKIKQLAFEAIRYLLSTQPALRLRYPDLDEEIFGILKRVLPYTMTSPARIAALCSAIKYVEANKIPGAFVECGVWRGGSSMAAALSFRRDRACRQQTINLIINLWLSRSRDPGGGARQRRQGLPKR
jgi:hypothetical protein